MRRRAVMQVWTTELHPVFRAGVADRAKRACGARPNHRGYTGGALTVGAVGRTFGQQEHFVAARRGRRRGVDLGLSVCTGTTPVEGLTVLSAGAVRAKKVRFLPGLGSSRGMAPVGVAVRDVVLLVLAVSSRCCWRHTSWAWSWPASAGPVPYHSPGHRWHAYASPAWGSRMDDPG